jgi:hypothetical protein
MRGSSHGVRGFATFVALLAFSGCSNDVPTATGSDLFPGGTEMTTIEVLLPASEVLSGDTVFDGYTGIRNASYLLVANDFDGGLNAHALARFGAFPDSVTYTGTSGSVNDKTFTYASGRITALLDTIAYPDASLTLRLYALEQPWDSLTATWENASEGPAGTVKWRTPGGTLGNLLAQATWERGDTLLADTIVWNVDSLAMKQIATPGFAGVAVTAVQSNLRVQISGMDLMAKVHPSTKPDTTLQVSPAAAVQRFIFTPSPPTSPTAFRVGGLTSARSAFRLKLDLQVPTCAPPLEGCPQIPLKDVTLNLAHLVLEPLPVPSGYRPTVAAFLQVRRLLEPELGRQSSLGEVIAQDSVPASLFVSTAGKSENVDLTNIYRAFADSTSIDLALLSTSRTASFGTLWFSRMPRLRLVYTLPRTPDLP